MVIRMSDFKKEVTPAHRELPSWARTETISKLYHVALDIYTEIQESIDRNQRLSVRERQISYRSVALKCQLSPSILHPRRQPELVKFITELNLSLSHAFTSAQAKVYSSGRKLNKSELLKQNKLLKEEISRLNNVILADAFNQAIENLLVQQSRQAALTIRNLREKISELELVISKQADQNRRYMDLAVTNSSPSSDNH